VIIASCGGDAVLAGDLEAMAKRRCSDRETENTDNSAQGASLSWCEMFKLTGGVNQSGTAKRVPNSRHGCVNITTISVSSTLSGILRACLIYNACIAREFAWKD